MQRSLDFKGKALYVATGEVLHYIWDPIGVAGTPQARDEYDSYVAQVFSLVNSGADEAQISALLNKIASEAMGLDSAQKCSENAASALVEWRNHVAEMPG